MRIWLALMGIGAKSGCHQRADRSFFINGYQFPVCARCMGVLIGYVLSVVTLKFFFLLPIIWCLFFCLVMFIDWLLQYVKLLASKNIRRLITGIIGGYGLLSLEINVMIIIFNNII